MRLSQRQLEEFARRLEPGIRDAFLEAVADVRRSTSIGEIERIIRDGGSAEQIMLALGVDSAWLSGLTEAQRQVFVAATAVGISEVTYLRMRSTQSTRAPTARFRFDMRNPAAESWLSRESSRLVTDIVSSQRDAIMQTLSAAFARGQGPRQTALDIVGRIGATGRRTGGIVGLTGQMAGYVENMRDELLTGDPDIMARYFNRVRRDARFDRAVQAAIDAGKPLPRKIVDRIAGRYADRLLQLRGENIARTETIASLNASREQSVMQAVESGLIRAESVKKRWSATLDSRTRDLHSAMNGQIVAPDQPFRSGSGALMMYPGDTSLGAGGGDVINCRCMAMFDVDMISETLR